MAGFDDRRDYRSCAAAFISAYLAEYPEWRMIIYSITLIVLMLRRPQGLFGNKELSLKMFHLGGGKDGALLKSK